METASGVIRLKPDCEQKLEEWRQTLSRRLDEVTAVLGHEGVEIESWFKFEMGNRTYLLWYMRAQSIEEAFEAFQSSTHPIDIYHMEIMSQIMADNGSIVATPLLDMAGE